MAGQRQYNNLLALFDNWSMYTDALNTSKNSLGELQKQQDIYMESTAAHIEKLNTAEEKLYDAFIDNKSMNDLIDVFTKLVEGTANWVEAIGGGGNTLLTLGSIATTVFNKQIASGLETTIKNFRVSKENAEQLARQLETIKFLEQSIQESGGKSTAVSTAKEQLEARKPYESSMTPQEIEAHTKLIEQYALATDKAAQLKENMQSTAQFIKGRIEASPEEKESAISRLKTGDSTDIDGLMYSVEEKTQEIFKQIDSISEKDVENAKKYVDDFKALFEKTILDIKNNLDETMELPEFKGNKTFEKISEDMGKYFKENGEVIDLDIDINEETFEKDITNIKEKLTQEKDNILNTVKDINNAPVDMLKEQVQAFKDAENEATVYGNALKEANEGFNLRYNIEQVTSMVGGIGQLTSGIMSLKNIGNILNDDSLSGFDKFLQITMAATTGISMAVMGVTALGGAISKLAAAQGIANMILAEGVTIQTIENALEGQSVLNKIALILYTGKLTIVKIAQTVANKALAASQAVLNALMSPYGALIVAATVAVVGLAVATDK